jgi:hypothetical protein
MSFALPERATLDAQPYSRERFSDGLRRIAQERIPFQTGYAGSRSASRTGTSVPISRLLGFLDGKDGADWNKKDP